MPSPITPQSPPPTINLIVGLLRDYLSLNAEQVVLYNQKWKIPNTNGLFISVGYLSITPYGSTKEYVQDEVNGKDVLKEVVTTNIQETYSINIYSRDQSAVQRQVEVLQAFASTLAQQICERYSVKFGQLPVAFTDISGRDGPAVLNRFNCTINALCARTQERIVESFNQFQKTGLIIEP